MASMAKLAKLAKVTKVTKAAGMARVVEAKSRHPCLGGFGFPFGFPQFERQVYGDRQRVAESRQAKSCHGCVHEAALYFAENSLSWEILKYCGKGRRHGKQCGLYQSKRSRK
jgi:hypothetical protein